MKKFIITVVMALIAILTINADNTAFAYDAETDMNASANLGSAIYMDSEGVIHTSDGHDWYGHNVDLSICTGAGAESDVASEIGSAIWMGADGIVRTSDGHAWYADSSFCLNHGAELGQCDDANIIYGTAVIDENGILTLSIAAESLGIYDGACTIVFVLDIA